METKKLFFDAVWLFFYVVYLINKLFPCPSLASQFFTISEPKKFAQVPANGHKSSIHLLLLIDFESTRDGIDKRKLCWFTISYINVVSPGVGLLCVLRKNKKRASSSRDRKARESIKLLCPVKLMFYVFLNWESFFFFCSFALHKTRKYGKRNSFLLSYGRSCGRETTNTIFFFGNLFNILWEIASEA